MQKDIYYYKPDVPLFIIDRAFHIARVRSVRIKNGRWNAVMADNDFDRIGHEFHPIKEYLHVFHCIIRTGEDTYRFGTADTFHKDGLRMEVALQYNWNINDERISRIGDLILLCAIRVKCPIVSEEEARNIVFMH